MIVLLRIVVVLKKRFVRYIGGHQKCLFTYCVPLTALDLQRTRRCSRKRGLLILNQDLCY